MKIEFSSQWREVLLFLITTMAAVMSRANQQSNDAPPNAYLHIRKSLRLCAVFSNVSFVQERMIILSCLAQTNWCVS